MSRNFELLSPAGNLEKMKTVYHYGADAVYLGGRAFNLRAASHNFSKDELIEAVEYAHSIGKKVYVALNIIAHNREIKALPQFIKFLEEAKVDAVIVADLGVMSLVKENSKLPIHISTQASTANWAAVKMYKELGAKRVVLARECSLSEIRQISKNVPGIELETFVHGSMCMTYSGRCMLSQYMTSRDGNRGSCSNSCRYKYSLQEEKRPGEYYPVYEDETGSYIYNSKDLCTVDFLDEILDAGVHTLKIEGRMKTMFYGATVTRVYRQALDAYKRGEFKQNPLWREELEAISNRRYTTGFFFGELDKNCQNFEGGYTRKKDYVGSIRENLGGGEYLLDVRGRRITPGQKIEWLSPKGDIKEIEMPELISVKNGQPLDVVNPGMSAKIKLDMDFEPFDILQTDADVVDSNY